MVLLRGLNDCVFLVLTSCRVQTVPSGQFTVGWSFWASLCGRPPPRLSLPSQDRGSTKARTRLAREAGKHTLRPTAEPPWSPQPPRPPFLFHDKDRRTSQVALVVKNPPTKEEL